MWSGLNDHRWGPTMETRRIEITPGMTFDVSVDGIDAAPLVLMLHGFGVSRFFWNCPGPGARRSRVFRRGAEPAGVCGRCTT